MPTELKKIDELRAKLDEHGERMETLAKEFEANGQKWKDDESRAAFNAAKDERAKIETDLKAEHEAEESREIAAVISGKREFDKRSLTRSIPGREDQRYGGNPDKITDETRCLAFAGWCMGDARTDKHIEAMRSCGLNGALQMQVGGWDNHRFTMASEAIRYTHGRRLREELDRHEESRAMSSFVAASGGALMTPQSMINRLEINLLAFGGVRQAAETFVTSTGERTSHPTADDTSNTGFQIGENQDVSATTEVLPTMNNIFWDSYEFSSGMIKVPNRAMRDSMFALPAMIGDMLGVRLGRITATRHTTGSGANTCKGIVTASALGVTSASATAITFDEVQALIHSIDPAYRTGAAFMFHDSIWLYLKKLKDGIGRNYIMEDVTAMAVPRLFGYPVYISQEMQSSVTTATKTMLFGQLSAHKIRRIQGTTLTRLDERYAEFGQTAFTAILSEDSNTLNAGTAPIKHMLQA